MKTFKIYHLYWEKHLCGDDDSYIFNDFDTDRDFGLYQVYGNHPVYGNDTLLYIGKAAQQTLSKRMKGHYDLDACQTVEQYTRIHFGRFCKVDDMNQQEWEDAISLVEPILIKAHMPALNSQDVKGFLPAPNENDNILVFNWGDKGSIFPEVSNLRCSAYYHDSDKYNFKELILRDETGLFRSYIE